VPVVSTERVRAGERAAGEINERPIEVGTKVAAKVQQGGSRAGQAELDICGGRFVHNERLRDVVDQYGDAIVGIDADRDRVVASGVLKDGRPTRGVRHW
jgi:hypothetical protein